MNINVTIQLDGTARILAKRKEIYLTVETNATWREVITELANAAPALVGAVIAKDKRSLVGTLNRSGKESIRNLDAQVDLSAGDFLMILEDAC
jgi:hypothetical protein